MQRKKHPNIQDFLHFLDQSPTSWHAVENAMKKFKEAGFQELSEENEWVLEANGRYYLSRNDSSLIAFILPSKIPNSLHIVGSHTDSPALKLKPNSEFVRENLLMFAVEPYGSPLLSSWLNRDLGIAGRIVHRDKKNKVKTSLVRLDEHPVVIPQLAIHLDRGVNESGLVLNKQEHLSALVSTTGSSYLENHLKAQVDFQSLLGTDLFLFPLEPAKQIGFQDEMIASYRLDSLQSVYAALEGLIHAKENHSSGDVLKMVVFWDHEEVGSETASGAASPFIQAAIERITLSLGLSREYFLRLMRHAFCLSVDLAHALHPNYMEKHDPRHPIFLNKGIVIKSHAQQRYSSDAVSSGAIVNLCQLHQIPYQHFNSRNDMPCGTTIGPINAHTTGIPTVDIGIPQLSMHSIRELIGVQDHLSMCQLLEHFFSQTQSPEIRL